MLPRLKGSMRPRNVPSRRDVRVIVGDWTPHQGSGSLAGSALMLLDEEAVFPCVPAAMVLRAGLSYSESLSKITESQCE